MLWKTTSWNHLEFIAAYFFIYNDYMNANSVAKHCIVVLNVKLQVKVRFKTFYSHLKLSYTAFASKTTMKTACFAQHVLHILAMNL